METHIEKHSFKQTSEGAKEVYQNFVLEQFNDHCLRMSVFECEYPWHYHPDSDEVFIVLEGELKIEINEQDTLHLFPGEYTKIPALVIHRTTAIGRVINLCIEKNEIKTVFVD